MKCSPTWVKLFYSITSKTALLPPFPKAAYQPTPPLLFDSLTIPLCPYFSRDLIPSPRGTEAENILTGIELKKNLSLLIPSRCTPNIFPSIPKLLHPKTFSLLKGACLLYLTCYLGGQKEAVGLPSFGSLSPGERPSGPSSLT